MVGIGESWWWDVGIPQGCVLSMCFIVALCAPWRRRLEALPGIEPLLYADNLKCSAVCPNALFGVAGFTARYVRSGRMCLEEGVLLSTSMAARKGMKLWDVSDEQVYCWMGGPGRR